MESKKKLRVVIVGGSVAGLTLANALSKTDIDFVVLESRDEIAPQVGASIGILPNGGRILDQLGMFDETLEAVEPLRESFVYTDQGNPIIHSRMPMVIHERHGYPAAFLDRQQFLRILYKHLREYQGRVHMNKKVVRVEQFATHAVVHCADGSAFEGDVVVGADGVRSRVRQEMWRYMEDRGLKREVVQEKSKMTAEYSCVFGISTATPGLKAGESHRTFAKGYSHLLFVGKDDRVFWFLFARMEQRYSMAEIPRFGDDDLHAHLTRYMDTQITPTVAFRDVYRNVVTSRLVPLEEAFYEHWCMDRIVCIGDAVHKMTPNLGQGGNAAIESAALLANCLVRLGTSDALSTSDASPTTTSTISTSGTGIPPHEVHRCLQNWETDRQHRARLIWTTANGQTRIEAYKTWKDSIIAHYLLPRIQTYLLNKQSRLIVGAEKLDFVPLRPRALQCTMPYTEPDRPSLQEEGVVKRALWASPLVGCYGVARVTMGGVIAKLMPHVTPFVDQGTWTASNGEVIRWMEPVYNIEILDKILQPLMLCFLPSISGSDPVSRAQMITFLTDLGPVYGIWLLESYRKGHSASAVLLPTLMGVAFQLKGIGMIAPLYYLIEYIRAPLSNLLKNDNREMKRAALATLLPALLAGYYLPTWAHFFAPTVEKRRFYNAIWQLFPVIVPLLQVPFRLLASTPAATEATTQEEKATTKKKNSRYIRATYLSLAAISAASFIYARATAPEGTSVVNLFFPALDGHVQPVTSFAEAVARFLQYDQVISMASSFLWLGLRFRELKRHGAKFSWWKALAGGVATTLTCGPGAAIALAWGWREEMLSTL